MSLSEVGVGLCLWTAVCLFAFLVCCCHVWRYNKAFGPPPPPPPPPPGHSICPVFVGRKPHLARSVRSAVRGFPHHQRDSGEKKRKKSENHSSRGTKTLKTASREGNNACGVVRSTVIGLPQSTIGTPVARRWQRPGRQQQQTPRPSPLLASEPTRSSTDTCMFSHC